MKPVKRMSSMNDLKPATLIFKRASMQHSWYLTFLCLMTLSASAYGQATPPAVIGERYTVSNQALNMRSAPSTQATVLTKLTAGDEVVLLGVEGTWWQVTYAGMQGYVASQYLKRDALAGWERTAYTTGATPACENVSPKFDYGMDNYLRVVVGNNTDVVVKLMKKGYSDDCIRIVYVRAGDTYEIRNIPEGRYYLKIAYGKDYRQKIEGSQCHVRFVRSPLYEKGDEILDFTRKYVQGGYQEPSFELSLNVINTYGGADFNSNTISEAEFNR